MVANVNGLSIPSELKALSTTSAIKSLASFCRSCFEYVTARPAKSLSVSG